MNKYVVTYEDEWDTAMRKVPYRNRIVYADGMLSAIMKANALGIKTSLIIQIERVEVDADDTI